MIYTFLGATSHMEWTIYLDPTVKFHCGLPLSGDNRIRLAVNEGHVDTTPLYTSDQGRHLLHPEKIDSFYWLPMVDPHAWKCQTGSWKSAWSIHLESGSWLQDFGACFVAREKMAWNAFGSISLTLIRIGRYIGQTCNAKDGLVKVLLDVREGTLRFHGREGSHRRRSSFDPASSSHHG